MKNNENLVLDATKMREAIVNHYGKLSLRNVQPWNSEYNLDYKVYTIVASIQTFQNICCSLRKIKSNQKNCSPLVSKYLHLVMNFSIFFVFTNSWKWVPLMWTLLYVLTILVFINPYPLVDIWYTILVCSQFYISICSYIGIHDNHDTKNKSEATSFYNSIINIYILFL